MNLKDNGELIRILGLSFCFTLLYSADVTLLNMQKVIVSSIEDDKPGFKMEGFTVSGVMNTVFAISVWFGPYFTHALGAKLTMIISSIGFLLNVSAYAVEEGWCIYTGAVISGISAGAIWPAFGSYMYGNSSPETTSRNVAIFWFMFAFTGLVGNVFIYFSFYGMKYINQASRRSAIYSLMAVNVLAVLSFLLLPKSKAKKTEEYGPIKTIRKCCNLLISQRMLFFVLTLCYKGLELSFWNGIYSPSIGFTLGFGDTAKQLVALSGMFMSLGSFLGSFSPIVFAGWIRRHSYARRLIVLVGISSQLVAYLITYINLPDSAVFGNTHDESLIHPSAALAMLGSTLLCFGDFSITTQAYAFIGDHYRDTSAEACALYKFGKSVFVAVSFYSCSRLGLHTQVLILSIMAGVGLVGFLAADRDCPQLTSARGDQGYHKPPHQSRL